MQKIETDALNEQIDRHTAALAKLQRFLSDSNVPFATKISIASQLADIATEFVDAATKGA